MPGTAIAGALAAIGSGSAAAGGMIVGSAAASAASSIYSAKKQSSTAEHVAAQQIAAAERAQKLETENANKQLEFLKQQDQMDREQAEIARRQGYDTSEAARAMSYAQWTDRQRKLAPYQGMGQASAGTLANLMGFKPETMAVSEPTAAVPYQNIPYTPYKTDSLIPGSLSGSTPPASNSLASLATPTTNAGAMGMPASGGMVWMQAPDGTKKQVPSFAIPHYQRLGATVLSTPSWQTGAVA